VLFCSGVDLVGSFLNYIPLAHFVVLGVGRLLALLVGGTGLGASLGSPRPGRRPRSPRQTNYRLVAVAAALAAAVFTVLLSLSRGGALALAAASAVSLVYYWRRGAIDARLGLALAAAAVAVVALLGVYGYDRVAGRLDDFAGGSLDQLDSASGRRQIWAANVAAIRAGGLFGAGAGAHAEVHAAYLSGPSDKWFTHAENGYLQVLTENGAAGGALLAAALVLVTRWCYLALRRSATRSAQLLAGAVAASLAASVVHSLVDFVWYIPACMSATVMLAACACRLAELAAADPASQSGAGVRAPESAPRALPRFEFHSAYAATLVGVAGLCALAAAFRPARASLAWDRYQLATIAQVEQAERQLRDPQAAEEAHVAQEVLLESMIVHLEEVVRLRPDAARAHQRLSNCYMHAFELRQLRGDNAMPIAQIGDAAMAARFRTPAELRAWLQAAFGDQSQLLARAHAHARRAAELAPLIPDSYLHLAKLCFLEGRDSAFAAACVDQALRLGPHDGDVLYEAGVELGVLGDWRRANDCWQQAFRAGSVHQLHIIQSAPGRIPVASFLAALKPDWKTLGAAWTCYAAAGVDRAELELLASYASEAARRETPELPPADQARIWLSLGLMRRELADPAAAIACFERGAAVDPSHYPVRRQLALALAESSRATDAEPHLRWCLARRPDDARVAEALAAAARSRGWAPSFPAAASQADRLKR
jgi:tetratricopeptide (TPR) repeat protein